MFYLNLRDIENENIKRNKQEEIKKLNNRVKKLCLFIIIVTIFISLFNYRYGFIFIYIMFMFIVVNLLRRYQDLSPKEYYPKFFKWSLVCFIFFIVIFYLFIRI